MPNAPEETDAASAVGAAWVICVGLALACLVILALFHATSFDPFVHAPSRLGRVVRMAVLLMMTVGFAAALVRYVPIDLYRQGIAALGARPAAVLAAIAGTAILLSALISKPLLHAFPISGDEYAYLLQATMFRHGQLSLPALPIQRYLDEFFIFDIHGRMVSQYPPGWPALLAIAQALRFQPGCSTLHWGWRPSSQSIDWS